MEQKDNDSSPLKTFHDVVSQGCILDNVSLSFSNSGYDDAPEYCVPVSGIDSELCTSTTNHDSPLPLRLDELWVVENTDIHHIETSPQVAIMESTRDKC
jgi:hypothetical protein